MCLPVVDTTNSPNMEGNVMCFRRTDTWVRPYGRWQGWAKFPNVFCYVGTLWSVKKRYSYGNAKEAGDTLRWYLIEGADPCVRPW